MPIERAEPAIVRTAALSAAVKSFCFTVAISSACLRVILPTLSVCGLEEPLVIPCSFFDHVSCWWRLHHECERLISKCCDHDRDWHTGSIP